MPDTTGEEMKIMLLDALQNAFLFSAVVRFI
jgi:hypothetical protein